MYVCMYVYVCICMYVCVYVCMCVCVYIYNIYTYCHHKRPEISMVLFFLIVKNAYIFSFLGGSRFVLGFFPGGPEFPVWVQKFLEPQNPMVNKEFPI